MSHMSAVATKAIRWIAAPIKWLVRSRWRVQLLFLFLLNPFGLFRFDGFCLPVLNCHGCPAASTTCPIGASGHMLAVGAIPWMPLGIWGLIGSIFGRLSCGWVCPFGFIQDLLAKIPLPKWNPPRWTRFIKYAVLFGMVFLVAVLVGTKTRWFFCGICPAATIFANGWYWIKEGMQVPLLRIAFLIGFVVLMLFVRRGFCRIVCPIGAGLAFFNRIALLSLKYLPRWCSDCMLCLRSCPSGKGPLENPRDAECVYCLDCFKCSALGLDFVPDKEKK